MKHLLLFCTFSFLQMHSMEEKTDIYVMFHNPETQKTQLFLRIKPIISTHDNNTQSTNKTCLWYTPLQNLFANPQGVYFDMSFSQVADSIKKSKFHPSLKNSLLTVFEPVALVHELLFHKNRRSAYYEIMPELEYLIYQMINDKILNDTLESINDTTAFIQKDYYQYFLSKVHTSIVKAYTNEIKFYEKLITGSLFVTLLGMVMPCPFHEYYETGFLILSSYLLFWEVCFYYNFYHKYAGCEHALEELKKKI